MRRRSIERISDKMTIRQTTATTLTPRHQTIALRHHPQILRIPTQAISPKASRSKSQTLMRKRKSTTLNWPTRLRNEITFFADRRIQKKKVHEPGLQEIGRLPHVSDPMYPSLLPPGEEKACQQGFEVFSNQVHADVHRETAAVRL